MTMTGTSYFATIEAANAYYAPYGNTPEDVQAKLDAGEIHIGKPECGSDEFAVLRRDEGRYFIRPATSREKEAREFAERIKALGFAVYMTESGTHGFITDDTESRVLSFSFSGIGSSLGGNYGPPSTTSGTGWGMGTHAHNLQTADDVRRALYEHPPAWCGKGWKRLSTVKDHLAVYGASSRFVRL